MRKTESVTWIAIESDNTCSHVTFYEPKKSNQHTPIIITSKSSQWSHVHPFCFYSFIHSRTWQHKQAIQCTYHFTRLHVTWLRMKTSVNAVTEQRIHSLYIVKIQFSSECIHLSLCRVGICIRPCRFRPGQNQHERVSEYRGQKHRRKWFSILVILRFCNSDPVFFLLQLIHALSKFPALRMRGNIPDIRVENIVEYWCNMYHLTDIICFC